MATAKLAASSAGSRVQEEPSGKVRPTIRSLHVISSDPQGSGMIFAKRESASLAYAEIVVRQFFLRSRTSPISLVRDFVRFRKEISDFQPQVIHAHFGTVTGLFCGLATTLPLVVTFRGTDLNPDPTLSLARSLAGRFFSQLTALRASQMICVTKRLKNKLWWRQNRATVLSGCIDLDLFHPQSRQEARAALGWPADENVVLFNAGRAPRIKRLDLAEAAVKEANNRGCSIRMVVLNGQTEPNEIPLYLNAADCLLITSDWEGSPYIVREALCCNLPIISVDVGDVAERVEGVSPSCIVAKEVRALGAAVAEVLALGCRSNGRLTMLDLSEEKVAEKVRGIYEQVVGSKDLIGSHTAETLTKNPGAEQA